MASSSSTTRIRGGEGVMSRVRCGRADSPAEEVRRLAARGLAGLALGDVGADGLAIRIQALAQTFAGGAGPGTLLGGVAELPELPIAPQLVPELLFDDLDHDRVVEEAEGGDLVGNQVLGVGEVGDRGEYLLRHLLRGGVVLVLDQVREI